MVSQQLESNYQFFMEADVSKYADEWIAIVDGEIVFHSPNLKEVLGVIEKKYSGRKPLVYKVPGKESMIF